MTSELLQKRTPLIQQLEETFARGLDAQREFMASRSKKGEVFYKETLNDLPAVEIGKYFRNRTLNAWAKNPTAESAPQVLENTKSLLAGFDTDGGNTFQRLYDEAESYVNGVLSGGGL